MSRGLNELVPKDDLYWDRETNTYNVLSKDELSEVIKACLRVGMDSESDIIKVVEEYERVRAGDLLFRRFFLGRIGVYEFAEDNSPIFEPLRADS